MSFKEYSRGYNAGTTGWSTGLPKTFAEAMGRAAGEADRRRRQEPVERPSEDRRRRQASANLPPVECRPRHDLANVPPVDRPSRDDPRGLGARPAAILARAALAGAVVGGVATRSLWGAGAVALGFAATTAVLVGLTVGVFGLLAGISHLSGRVLGARGWMKIGFIGAVVGLSAGAFRDGLGLMGMLLDATAGATGLLTLAAPLLILRRLFGRA